MQPSFLPKCLLLAFDGTDESLLPVQFIRRLYPGLDRINLLISYFKAPLSPIHQQRSTSQQMAAKKKDAIQEREMEARAAMERARGFLIEAGFSREFIQEHIQEKVMSAAHHTCQLADIKKVDAVLVQKRISSPLEGFLRDDPRDALLHHCIISPIWFTAGDIDPSRAVICVQGEDASLRAVDHAAFMLAETETRIDLLHISDSVGQRIGSPVDEHSSALRQWFKNDPGRAMSPFIKEACDILQDAGIPASRTRITIIPGSAKEGKVALRVLSHAKDEGIGIVVLGYSNPRGVWSFLKTSVTKKILDEFQDMAIWVNQ